MTTSALVLTLCGDVAERQRLLAQLRADAHLTLGEPSGLRLPVVLEADDGRCAEDQTRALAVLPGVMHLEIVFVGFDDGAAVAPALQES